MAMETSEIQFGQTGISYKIRRSPRRRKTVEVTVDPRQGVVVAAPERVPTGCLDSIVRQKARWILERQRRFQQANPAIAPREFVSGESVWYLGRHYRLKVLANPNRAKASLVSGWLRVPRHSTPATRDGSEVVRASVIAWYHQRATTRLPERVARWCGKVGVAMPALVVADQQKRWGSCSSRGTVRLNWRIVQAPMRLVDYVVVHELAHLLHQGHGMDYWRALGKVMPDYERRREELRRIGSRLEW